jgi:hypothetical protein
MKGKPRDEIDRASDQAVRETLFRFHLALRINVVSHDILEREELLAALFSTRIALLTAAPARKRDNEDDPTELEQLRDLIMLSSRGFRAVGAAREEVERRYLAGHPALFPDEATRWVEQVKTSESIEALAIRMATLDGVPDALLPPPDAFNDRVAHYVADFVEPAKVAALEDLDEGRQALGIATSWLRGKMQSAETGRP